MKYNKKLMEYNRLDNQVDRLYSAYLSSVGISETAMWILYSAYTSNGAVTQAEICENWCCAPQTIHSALKVLEKKGFVQILLAEGNKKNKYIHLTDEGVIMCRRIVEPLVSAENKAFSKLTDEEQKQLVSLFRKYSNALKREMRTIKEGADYDAKAD